jgi:putative endonuclease
MTSGAWPLVARPGTHNPGLPAMDKQFFVYILASRKHGTLYIGITSDLIRRVHEHKLKVVPGFTKKYGVDKLVYYEIFDDPISAITREKQLKKWHREWKLRLIESSNPEWIDLSANLI